MQIYLGIHVRKSTTLKYRPASFPDPWSQDSECQLSTNPRFPITAGNSCDHCPLTGQLTATAMPHPFSPLTPHPYMQQLLVCTRSIALNAASSVPGMVQRYSGGQKNAPCLHGGYSPAEVRDIERKIHIWIRPLKGKLYRVLWKRITKRTWRSHGRSLRGSYT